MYDCRLRFAFLAVIDCYRHPRPYYRPYPFTIRQDLRLVPATVPRIISSHLHHIVNVLRIVYSTFLESIIVCWCVVIVADVLVPKYRSEKLHVNQKYDFELRYLEFLKKRHGYSRIASGIMKLLEMRASGNNTQYRAVVCS